MKPTREKWLERLITKKLRSAQRCMTLDCAQEFIAAYGISKMSRAKEAELIALIRRTKNRVKKRIAKYNSNLHTVHREARIPVELIHHLEKLNIIDLSNTVLCHKIIKFTHYRDFCISHDLQGHQIPDDTTIPMHHWI